MTQPSTYKEAPRRSWDSAASRDRTTGCPDRRLRARDGRGNVRNSRRAAFYVFCWSVARVWRDIPDKIEGCLYITYGRPQSNVEYFDCERPELRLLRRPSTERAYPPEHCLGSVSLARARHSSRARARYRSERACSILQPL